MGEVRLRGWGPGLILPGCVTLGRLLSLSELLLPLLWSGLIPATRAPLVVPWLMSAKHSAMENTQQSPAACLLGRDSAAGAPPPGPPAPFHLASRTSVAQRQCRWASATAGRAHAGTQEGKAPGIAPLRKKRDRGKDRKDTHCAFCHLGIFKSKWGGGWGRSKWHFVSHCWLGASPLQ